MAKFLSSSRDSYKKNWSFISNFAFWQYKLYRHVTLTHVPHNFLHIFFTVVSQAVPIIKYPQRDTISFSSYRITIDYLEKINLQSRPTYYISNITTESLIFFSRISFTTAKTERERERRARNNGTIIGKKIATELTRFDNRFQAYP